jgi:hypothetical protein
MDTALDIKAAAVEPFAAGSVFMPCGPSRNDKE